MPPPVSKFYLVSTHTLANRVGRLVWGVVCFFLFRPSPYFLYGWRRFLLRSFGAKMGQGTCVASSTKIWAPWNLEMADFSCLGAHVDCYTVGKIRLGLNAVVSQYSFLCTASHDIQDPDMRLTHAPISIGDRAWVAASAFVGPGVTVGDGAVVAACAVVVKDVPAWTVAGGNPAKVLKKREISTRPPVP